MDDLEDLIITLNTRLCYFFDLWGSIEPIQLYDTFIQDLDNQAIFFLELEEQDEGIR